MSKKNGYKQRKKMMEEILSLGKEWLSYPNECAYTDRLVEDILSRATEINDSIEKELNCERGEE